MSESVTLAAGDLQSPGPRRSRSVRPEGPDVGGRGGVRGPVPLSFSPKRKVQPRLRVHFPGLQKRRPRGAAVSVPHKEQMRP